MPSARKELKKGLSTLKIPKVPSPLNAIAAERECDPIIDVQCNGLVLHGVLVDGGARVNVMIIPAMRYLGLKIDRPTSVTIVDFHVMLEEDGAYPMILGRPWLTKSHAKNY